MPPVPMFAPQPVYSKKPGIGRLGQTSHNWDRPRQGQPACELWMSPDWAWTYVHYSVQPRLDGWLLPLGTAGA